jgi:hypothetical protein
LENMVNGNHLRPISHWAVHRTLRPEENSMHNQSIWLHRSFLALPSRGIPRQIRAWVKCNIFLDL